MSERYEVYQNSSSDFRWTLFGHTRNEQVARFKTEEFARYVARLLQKDDE